jgi:DNA-binding LacI/PurR family transcriptional regulator
MTREARANMGRIAAEQLVMTLDGKRPPRIVNPQVWPDQITRRGSGIRSPSPPARLEIVRE